MNFPFLDLLKLLPMVGPAVAQTAEFVEQFEKLIEPHDESDQAELKSAYADLVAENDAGHRRLQEKLAAAAKR